MAIAFPKINNFSINFPDGNIGKVSWKSYNYKKPQKLINTDYFSLMPSLKNNILYINSIKLDYYRTSNNITGNYNYIKKAKLEINTGNLVDLFVDPIEIEPSFNENNSYQYFNFLSDRVKFFEMQDLTKRQQLIFTLKISLTDTLDNEYVDYISLFLYYNINTIKGDVNGDGKVDLKDLVMLSEYVSEGKELSYLEAGDLTGDGVVDINDVAILSQRILHND